MPADTTGYTQDHATTLQRTEPGPDALPFTGLDVVLLVIVAVGLIAMGALLRFLARLDG